MAPVGKSTLKDGTGYDRRTNGLKVPIESVYDGCGFWVANSVDGLSGKSNFACHDIPLYLAFCPDVSRLHSNMGE